MKIALLLIDIQNGLNECEFYGGERNNLTAETNSARILSFFRQHNLPVYHVKHNSSNPKSPLHPDKPGNAIKAEVAPKDGEPIFEKSVNSAFIGTTLEETLREDGIQELIIVGLTTEHCISTSTRMAANLGFKTSLIADATAAFSKTGVDGKTYDAELIHQTQLATLKDEFASILTTNQLLETLSS